MKKAYITPECEVIGAETLEIMTDSLSVTGNPYDKFDIGYGGTDEDGEMTPSANGWGIDNWDTL